MKAPFRTVTMALAVTLATAGAAFAPPIELAQKGQWSQAGTQARAQLKQPNLPATVLPKKEDRQKRAVLTLKGHARPVNDVAFSPDGKRLASAGRDGMVRIWDTASGAELRKLHGHGEHAVQGVAYSPDGKWLASAGWDEKVVLWNAATGQAVRPHDVAGGGELASAVAFSPDSQWLVAAGELVAAGFDETIHIWDVATGKKQRTLRGHVNGIFSVTFNSDGKLLATAGSQDGDIILWDFATGRKLKTLEPKSSRIWQIAFHPDQKTLATAGEDGLIRLWDVATGAELRNFRGHAKGVMSVAFHKEGKLLASSGQDAGVKLWDFATGKELVAFTGHAGTVRRIAFRPDGKQLASASFDGTVKLWEVAKWLPDAKANDQDMKKAAPVRTLEGHAKEIRALAFNADGTLLVSGSEDTVRIWDTTANKSHALKADDRQRVNALAFTPDGKLLASAGWDATVRLWDPASGKLVRKFEAGDPNNDSVRGIAISPDGTKLIAVGMLVPAGDHEPIKIFNVATGQRERIVDSKITNGISSVAFHPDGKVFATNNYYEGPQLWDFATGRALTLFKHPAVDQVVFSRDGKLLAAVAGNEFIRLWDVPGARELRALRAKGSTVWAVAFSPDGKQLASAGHKDGSVRLWDVATGEALRTYKGHAGRSTRVAFHPDGKLLASAGADGTVKLWALTAPVPAANATGKQVEPVRVTLLLPGFAHVKAKDARHYPELHKALERLPTVQLEQNLLPFGPAGLNKVIGLEIGVNFDPAKADVGDLARAIAAVSPKKDMKSAAILLFVPREGDIPTRMDLTDGQRTKVREALVKVAGIHVKPSQELVEASAIGIVLDERGGARLRAIAAALKSAGVDVETGFRDPLLP